MSHICIQLACGKSFTTRRSLKIHCRKRHNVEIGNLPVASVKRAKVCMVKVPSDAVFTNNEIDIDFQQTIVCGKVFTDISNFKRHVNSKTNLPHILHVQSKIKKFQESGLMQHLHTKAVLHFDENTAPAWSNDMEINETVFDLNRKYFPMSSTIYQCRTPFISDVKFGVDKKVQSIKVSYTHPFHPAKSIKVLFHRRSDSFDHVPNDVGTDEEKNLDASCNVSFIEIDDNINNSRDWEKIPESYWNPTMDNFNN